MSSIFEAAAVSAVVVLACFILVFLVILAVIGVSAALTWSLSFPAGQVLTVVATACFSWLTAKSGVFTNE